MPSTATASTGPSPVTVHAFRLRPGQELKSCLVDFAVGAGLQAAFVMTCVGSVSGGTIRLAGAVAGQEPTLSWDKPREILSLVGTLSPSGVHLHISLGDGEGAVVGGHLQSAIVHTTAEVVLGEATALAFSREVDAATGYKELCVRPR